MTIENQNDLDKLRHIGKIVATVLHQMQNQTEVGMTTLELDMIGKQLLDKYQAHSAPKLSYGFNGYTCISINEEAAHGIPGPKIIKAGDMVNIDVSAEKDGYFADTGGSFVVPPSDDLKNRLIHSTKQALNEACKVATANAPINSIGRAIQKVAKRNKFKIIKNLCSHGVGRSLHEYPEEILGYFDRRDKRKLHEGLVITIEPFLSTKANWVEELDDGWTLAAPAPNLSAQFEHTMVITKGKPLLMTQL